MCHLTLSLAFLGSLSVLSFFPVRSPLPFAADWPFLFYSVEEIHQTVRVSFSRCRFSAEADVKVPPLFFFNLALFLFANSFLQILRWAERWSPTTPIAERGRFDPILRLPLCLETQSRPRAEPPRTSLVFLW